MSAAAFPSRPDRVVDGPTPKHAQLREILRHAVERELPPGSPIPSERELAERYQVSRLTVRSAIGKLVEEGLLSRVRGKGTFTASRRMELQLYLMSFTDDMRRRGLEPTTEVLGTTTEVPPAATANALGLAEGATALRLKRLRRADGIPLAVERGWYHPVKVAGLFDLDLTRSLYAQLAEQDIRLDHAWQTVWAESADKETARLLGIRTGSPLLVFRRVSSMAGAPVEDMTSWYRGDHYQVTMQLDRSSPDSGNPAKHGGTR
ncbi:GntR family transcriptional regulator [Saccharothrix sp. AJ9571]|uniref:GntR family transcriptional regulator n=1 Tax=Amycolatopsis magusensis TaxID=882444 RepID=A0ABS4Q0M3_9PSEU|nr:GntR family transcriptional regulator [Amycolatopsis magusensis]MBP2185221.1 GntR family transcriptional regulator [Amycolatopsis magusensis]UJW28958.1 GntR family transcriptional regulator [Saccharothrix sp. AJ9571]